MKKSEYTAPEMSVLEFNVQSMLAAVSSVSVDGSSTEITPGGTGDGSDQAAKRGSLWDEDE